jgi:hypothetical protein
MIQQLGNTRTGQTVKGTRDVKKNVTNKSDYLYYFDSGYHDEMISKNKQQSEHIVKTTNDLFKNDVPSSKKYLNESPENKWFYENVSFLFVTGCIFDEIDRRYIDEVLSIFQDNKHTGFLKNYFKIMTYTDESVKRIEKKLAVKNGNYHIMLVVIVYETADLSKAPEPSLSKAGFIEHYLNWNRVTQYISKMVSRYGLLSNVVTKHQKETWEKIPTQNNEIKFDDIQVKDDLVLEFPSRIMNTQISRPEIGNNVKKT